MYCSSFNLNLIFVDITSTDVIFKAILLLLKFLFACIFFISTKINSFFISQVKLDKKKLIKET